MIQQPQRKLKERIDETMSKVETDQLGAFWDNERMREAVKKVLLFSVHGNGTFRKGQEKVNPLVNGAFGLISMSESIGKPVSNEELGQDLRAQWAAVGLLENAFNAISVYGKLPEELKDKKNQGS